MKGVNWSTPISPEKALSELNKETEQGNVKVKKEVDAEGNVTLALDYPDGRPEFIVEDRHTLLLIKAAPEICRREKEGQQAQTIEERIKGRLRV